MNDNRSIQRLDPRSQRGTIIQQQAPAIIQVIDIPAGSALGQPSMGGMGGMPAGRKVGGINIMGAILRRWWLVLLVTAVIGGGGMFLASNLKASYVATAKIRWTDNSGDGRGLSQKVVQASEIITSRRIPLLAAKEEGMEEIFRDLLKDKDIDNDPATQLAIVKEFREIVVAEVSIASQLVGIQCERKNRDESAVIANAFANAFVKYCREEIRGELGTQLTIAEQGLKDAQLNRAALVNRLTTIKLDNNFEKDAQQYSAHMNQFQKLTDDQLAARITMVAAQAKLKELEAEGPSRPGLQLEMEKLRDEEEKADGVLETYRAQLLAAIASLEQAKVGMTEEHPEVKRNRNQVERLKSMVQARKDEIASRIREKIEHRFKLMDEKTVAEARDKVQAAEKMLAFYAEEMAKMDVKAKKLVGIKSQVDALENQIGLVTRDYESNYTVLQDLKRRDRELLVSYVITVEETAQKPDKPNMDKRMKVTAAGLVGGLFLGMLLALLVDKFDRRLRDPRDIEPLLGAPLMGSIPKINELKRIKGEHARNLIAEEFRVIRTQLLFGNPEMQHKVIAITSPQPGDGKTSLAVNLAISIAKAGRRVLLIDSDLRKPDVHRIFNISDSPGFAEVIGGSHEPGAVIRKSDIDGLDVMPAGTPIVRPSELLSRPDVARVLSALSEVYDHLIIDTAPLLPVSDTHVLVGIVDGVMCSFNADVDRETVLLVQEILRRGRANIIGTVMNQVKYKQSGSYHRGKNAYSSYYSSTRVAPPAAAGQLPGKSDIASLGKKA